MRSHRKAPVSPEGQGWQRVMSSKCHNTDMCIHDSPACHLSPAVKDGLFLFPGSAGIFRERGSICLGLLTGGGAECQPRWVLSKFHLMAISTVARSPSLTEA